MLARVSWWLFANSRSLHPLSFVSPMPNLPTVPALCWYGQGLLWHSSRLELIQGLEKKLKEKVILQCALSPSEKSC